MLPKLDIGMLVKTIIENGEPSREDGRSPDSIRWHLAAAGQGYNSGSRRPLSNVGFNCRLVAENKKGKDEILFMIGQICSFVWECTQAMQDRSGQPRLGSDSRNQFSQKLRKLLNIERHQMGFDSITMGIMEIYPNVPRNEEHYDKFNCSLVTSNRTGRFNMVIVNPGTQKLYLLQFLLNFRVQITNYVMPYHSSVTNLVDNIRSLVVTIQESYNLLYRGRQMMSDMPTPFDRTGFFLEDGLAFVQVNLQTDPVLKEERPVLLDIVQLPIGFSRTMSLSAAIDTLNKSFQFLAFDQIVEMCFVCSLLNTPPRFHHVMECLLKKAESGEWSFQKHPFYDWLEMSMQTFGVWQGGPFSRYSPVGIGNIAKECFGGMQHDLTEVESSDGKRRLAQVVQILCKFIEWVNSLSRRITVTALSVPFLREKMLETCATIKDVVPSIEFKIFRLGIFLTHANGC